eukprot:6464987-Amphidinium_carterae.1
MHFVAGGKLPPPSWYRVGHYLGNTVFHLNHSIAGHSHVFLCKSGGDDRQGFLDAIWAPTALVASLMTLFRRHRVAR